jgi:hypothetical protein
MEGKALLWLIISNTWKLNLLLTIVGYVTGWSFCLRFSLSSRLNYHQSNFHFNKCNRTLSTKTTINLQSLLENHVCFNEIQQFRAIKLNSPPTAHDPRNSKHSCSNSCSYLWYSWLSKVDDIVWRHMMMMVVVVVVRMLMRRWSGRNIFTSRNCLQTGILLRAMHFQLRINVFEITQ